MSGREVKLLRDYLHIRSKQNRYSFDIPLDYNLIYITQVSGAGKTYFYEEILNSNNDDCELSVFGTRRVVTLPATDLLAIQLVGEAIQDTIIVVDEDSLNLNGLLTERFINTLLANCKKVVLISRESRFYLASPIQSLYYLSIENDGVYSVYSAFQSVNNIIGKYNYIVTESSFGKSEHLLLSSLFSDCDLQYKCASGRDNIFSTLRKLSHSLPNCRVLIVMDTCVGLHSFVNISSTAEKLGLSFSIADMMCFEALLYHSKLIVSRFGYTPIDLLRGKTLEQNYEIALRNLTKGTELEYSHNPNTVSECFVKKCLNCCDYGDENTLWKVLFNSDGIDLLSWYLANYTEFLNSYSYLEEDSSGYAEERVKRILLSCSDIYLGKLKDACFYR